MAKVANVEELLNNARKEVLDRSAMMLKRMVEGDTIDKEELAELKKLKTEIKFIETTQDKIGGGKGKKELSGKEVIARVNNITNTLGAIVRSMPTDIVKIDEAK